MTFKVTVSLGTAAHSIPLAAPAAGNYQVSILKRDEHMTPISQIDSPRTSFEFSGIPAGDYVAKAVRLDTFGAAIFQPVVYLFSAVDDAASAPTPPPVPAPAPVGDATMQTVMVPTSMTVTVTKE